ncbi:AEC family transporter [Calothrix sp. 336/3]|uniref:AEC family transporter n=1 Tax=Calothrix sp. 336/3 TaxID=1337936 RepID=UPI0004E42091|nr:AEC family transporter [Calothrix sp. 336/3]AKG21769.1 transporter [Calothrix sp. 336/3]
MTDTLIHAYTPLILWTSLGFIILRFLPPWFPHYLGRGLYWVGVPLELFALARQNQSAGLGTDTGFSLMPVIITIAAIVIGLLIAGLVLWTWQRIFSPESQIKLPDFFPDFCLDSRSRGSFLLAAGLGNTGFVGLAIAPFLVNADAMNWAVIFSITHNVIGPYGVGVIIASFYSHAGKPIQWWAQLREILTVPPLWAFIIGSLCRQISFPHVIESGLQQSISVVIALAFLLIGIRLAQLQGWKSLKIALFPAMIKVLITPLLMGLLVTWGLGLSGDRPLAMVLMSGMPTAFAGLILAEEYNLERDLIASSILLSTLLLLLVLPLWVIIFR